MLLHSFIFLIFAGIAKGFLDFYADSGIKEKEWKQKYKVTPKGDLVKTEEVKHWWYLGLYKPKYAEKFPFSTTALVSFTDRWHLSQLIMLRFVYLAISINICPHWWGTLLMSFVLFPAVVGVFFDYTYQKLKRRLIY